MDLYSVLVTGANRGIGLEFVRQLSRLQKPPRYIFATYRSESSLGALQEIKNASKESQIVLIKMEATNLDDIVAARKVVEQKVGENGLTLLINNAGVADALPFPNITEENLLYHFSRNTVAPIRIFQEMFPLLQKSASRAGVSSGMSVSRAAVLNMSSMAGSITRAGVVFTQDLVVAGYKTSKAALNMAMKIFAYNVKNQGILVISMCPGWVKTDMGDQGQITPEKDQVQISPEESISAILETLAKLDDSHHGAYMDRMGNPYPY